MFHLLLDGELYTPRPLGRGHILVCGGRVAWMGRDRPELPAALDVQITELGGARVIPGLVDGHVHVTGGGGEAGFASRLGPLEPAELLKAGITSVVGLLGTDDITRGTAELLAATRALCGRGVSAWCFTGGYHVPPVTLTGSIRGDLVHLDRVIGVGEIALSDHRSSEPTLDELLRVMSEAYMGGMLAGKAGITHLHMGDGSAELSLVREALIRSEIPPLVIQPTHLNRNRALFKEGLNLAGLGCPVDMTAFPASEQEDGLTATQAVAQYLDSGLPGDLLTVSSDAGGSLPLFETRGGKSVLAGYARQGPDLLPGALADLVTTGRPLEEVLPPFTSNPARILRLAGKGVLEVGADADLVILDARHGIDSVMSGGRWRLREKAPVANPADPATGATASR